jgi:solute carrier family 25 iron transporter 28/37
MVGAFSSMFHDLIMTPTEALKQRIQLMRSENPNVSVSGVAREIYRREGLVAFYRSFPVNYAMNIPFGSLIIAFNEKIKYLLDVK